MKEIKAILFDCDGVLLDSEPLGCEALARATTAAGVDLNLEEAVRIFSGNSSKASIAWMTANGLDAVSVYEAADQLLFEMFDREIPLIAGIEKVLYGFDVPMAVCSNSMIRRLDRSLARTRLAPRFMGHIYSAEHVARPKPAPDLVAFAARQLGIDPKDAVFIDDNPHGLRSGVEAGCLSVGFIGPSEHRLGHAEALREAGAHHIVHGMEEFHDLLSQLSLPRVA